MRKKRRILTKNLAVFVDLLMQSDKFQVCEIFNVRICKRWCARTTAQYLHEGALQEVQPKHAAQTIGKKESQARIYRQSTEKAKRLRTTCGKISHQPQSNKSSQTQVKRKQKTHIASTTRLYNFGDERHNEEQLLLAFVISFH